MYTEGRDRHLVSQSETAKATKRTINGERIYPPKNGMREELFKAAAPIVQPPPQRFARTANDAPSAHTNNIRPC